MYWFCKVLSIRLSNPKVMQMLNCAPTAGSMAVTDWNSQRRGTGGATWVLQLLPGVEQKERHHQTDTAISYLLCKWGTHPLLDKNREGVHFSHPSHKTVSLKQLTTCHPREKSETSACSNSILNCELIKSQKLSLGVTSFSGELKFTWKNSKSFKQNYSYNLAKETCIVMFLIAGVL